MANFIGFSSFRGMTIVFNSWLQKYIWLFKDTYQIISPREMSNGSAATSNIYFTKTDQSSIWPVKASRPSSDWQLIHWSLSSFQWISAISRPAFISELTALLPHANVYSGHCSSSLCKLLVTLSSWIYLFDLSNFVILKPWLFHHPHLPPHQLTLDNLLLCTVSYLVESSW